ncbi:phosphohydrolase [Roseibium algicola]|jgi:putative nucleotidyltransferase with HDIG domain|uniref:Phosphohydrolase n=1 Tax=Roseibium algicola TaxID=2857014 RepID=A0ABN4WUT3_9HYPH|nr:MULTISPECIES: HD domain-containing phosphohydrolase [Stappiaceae]AQQ05444.1 phosphohydrolase [Roseibium aggregatum]MBN8181575.1 HD domain-containing protein [Roseibium aggregatum]MBO6860426.1 HD domain-containing protein [Roseibium sp.]NKX65311.1 HD domain-containing protein [Labrenzia sp. 5N]UES43458.1 HD domain-containing protein [Roseibium aggregatum]
MEIVLISDGPLPLDSPVRKLPFFFPARLIDMSKVSAKTVGDGRVAVVELLDATDAGLTALKKSWASIAEIPVICLVSKKNRREVIQAAALGKTDIMERDTPLAILVRKLKAIIPDDPLANVPKGLPAKTLEAYRKGNSFLESIALSATEGSNIQISLMNEGAAEILSSLSLDGLSPWLEAVQSHHSGTYCHSLMVAGLAGAFAKHLGWSKADCQEVIAGGLLHDIGKMRIPLTILDKANKLTDAERAIIDKHPMFGREILKPRLEVSVDIKKMAIQHHEFLDGSGYPDGLKGDRISPKVRLMTICDIFTALTETRSYKDGMPVRAAIGVMLEMGKKLDQVMLKQFAQMVLDRDFGEVSRQPQKVKGTSAF